MPRKSTPLTMLRAAVRDGKLQGDALVTAIQEIERLEKQAAKAKRAEGKENAANLDRAGTWVPINRGVEMAYQDEIKHGRFQGSFREWLDSLNPDKTQSL